jgi:integrase/recombinase XerD
MATKPPPPPLEPLDDLLRSWTQVLKAENKAKSTVYNYTAHVQSYLDWCEERGETPRIDRGWVREWVAHLLAIRLEPTTVKARQLAMRSLSACMGAEDGIDYTDQLVGVKPPRVSEKLIQPLTEVQLKVLIAACDGKGLRDRRDEAIIRLMAETGMRVGEVVALQTTDVNAASGVVHIRKAKSGRGRVVSFSPKPGSRLISTSGYGAATSWPTTPPCGWGNGTTASPTSACGTRSWNAPNWPRSKASTPTYSGTPPQAGGSTQAGVSKG